MLRFVAIWARHCAIICLSLITAFGPTTHALAQTITAPSSFTGDPDNWQTLHSAGDPFDVDPGSITGSMRVTVSVSAGSGAIRINTTTGLTAPDGYTTAQWTSGSATEIAFEGMETALDNALASLQFRGSSGSISSTVTPAGAAYYAETGNFYRYIVSNDVDWTDANTQAGSVANQLNGITGYLASITSQGEMDFVVEKIGGTNPAWVGGSDATSEGTWRWRDPDGTDGDVFWNGAGSANGGAPATADTFHDWCSDQEPNNSSNEDYLQIRFTGGNTSCWNDLSNDGSNSASNDPDGFVAEYDGSSSAVVTTFSNVIPTAVSVARNNPSAQIILNTDFQGCSLTPSFTVTFSENVSNVDAADFEASGAGSTGVTVSGVTGSGSSYTVTLNCPGDNNRGALNLVLASGNNIQDSDNAGLASNSFSTSAGFILSERPVLSSITRANPSARAISANNLSGCYQPQLTATFSKSVQNVDASDFTVTGAGSTGVTIDTVTGSGTTRSITLDCLPSANRGALQLALVGSPSITDSDGTSLTSTSIASNEDYFITDAPVLSSVTRITPSARIIPVADIQSCLQPQLRATFSEAVSNVDTSDFTLTGAAAAGVSIDSLTGSGTTYTLTLSCIPSSNRGVIELAIDSGNDIIDGSSVGLGSTAISSNQDFEISDAPLVSAIRRHTPSQEEVRVQDIGACTQLQYRVTFSETVSGVDAADFATQGEGSTGLSIDTVNSVSGAVYSITLSCLPTSNRGQVSIALASSVTIVDTLNIALTSTSIPTSEHYTITETRTLPSEDEAVAEVVVASAEAPVVAMEKQVAHIQQRLSEQRAAPAPAAAAPDSPSAPLITPQRPPLTPTRKVEIVAQRIQKITQYFNSTENGNIFFETNSNALSTPARITLGRQLQQMRRYKSAVFQIEGHTDKRGSLAYNQKLGQRRAGAVRQYFIDNGIEAERVQIVSFGEERPVSGCNQESCWSKNRRAQTRLVINEALQAEIGNEIELEYDSPPQPLGEVRASWCGLVASLTVVNDSGAMQGDTPVLCGATEALAESLGPRWGVWTQGLLSLGVVQSDENSVEMDFLGQNLTFGVDYRFPDNTVLGVALGAGQNNMDGQDKSESITNQIVTSFYLARPFGDIWAVNLSGGLITSQIENRRPDEVSGDVMAGERDGSSHFTNIEVVRNTKVPYGKLDLTAGFTAMRTKLDAYNETGNQPLAFRAQTLDNESLSLGGTLAFDDKSQAQRETEAVLQYKLTASLQYDLSEASTARVNFVNVPAETDYVVLNQNDEPLTITIGGGMDWSNAQGTSLTLDYNYQQNATLSKIHSFSATYRKMF